MFRLNSLPGLFGLSLFVLFSFAACQPFFHPDSPPDAAEATEHSTGRYISLRYKVTGNSHSISALRLEYRRIYAITQKGKRQIDLTKAPGIMHFTDLNKSGSQRNLATLALPLVKNIKQFRVVVNKAYATINGREEPLYIGTNTRRHGFFLTGRDDILSIPQGSTGVFTMNIDPKRLISAHSDDEGRYAYRLEERPLMLGHIRFYRSLAHLPEDKDVQLSYRLRKETGWENIDQISMNIDSIIVNFAESDVSCEFDSPPVISMLHRREAEPSYPGAALYYAVPVNETLNIDAAGADTALDFPCLNRLPNGVILDIRLQVTSVQVSISGRDYRINIPDKVRREGLKLVPSTRLVPVCNDYIVSMKLELDAGNFLGADPRRGILASEVPGLITAPKLVLPDQPAIVEVPAAVRVAVPSRAVLEHVVVRLRWVDLSDMHNYNSADFVFRQIMQQVGDGYDFKPDGFEFQRPIDIAFALPVKHQLTERSWSDMRRDGVSEDILSSLEDIRNEEFRGNRSFFEAVKRAVDSRALVSSILNYAETKSLHAEKNLALYTFTPRFQIWSPDVPRILREHKLLATAELDRAIAAKETSDNLDDHFSPDYSALPLTHYRGLDIGRINRYEKNNYLVTQTNHFCLKSLFADLNVDTGGMAVYPPLLDGAFDDVCQLDGFGWVRDSNDDVHCGGALPSSYDVKHAYRKTRRCIDRNGIAVRVRNNMRNHFDEVTCPNNGTNVYCYDLQDFEDDVRWAIEVWREAINRNPDGSYTERLNINCWQMNDNDSNCSGDEIDIGLQDLTDEAGRTYGITVDIDLQTMQGAQANEGGRVEMRSTLVHELGHVLGLEHWAGAGTLMSFQGRFRRNTHKLNLCGTYSQAQRGTPPTPTSVAPGLAQDCQLPELDNRWGTSTVGQRRINRATCTDIERIRQQIRAGSGWTTAAPLYCEVLTERSEYAAGETPVFDSTANERYFEMSYDVRFPHCGDTPGFDSVTMEILRVDADNRTNSVINLYNTIYEVTPPIIGAGGLYNVPINLLSKEMTGASSQLNAATGITEFPAFTEFMDGDNTTGAVFPNLAMLLTVYKDVTSGGVRDRFVAGTTGLLRSPILSPLDANIELAVSDITLGGESMAANPLVTTFDDYITSPDLFPYIDDARLKPNAGRVLYVIVPPRNGRDLTNPALNYQVEFTWGVPDIQFAYGPVGPARIWVDSMEITREEIPTIDDWLAAGSAPLNSTPVSTTTYTGGAVPQDPCLHSEDSFTLFALGDVPMRNTTVGIDDVNLWDLYHVRINYDYVQYNNCPAGADVCTVGGVCSAGALTGTRSQDFYISISGPTGSIIQPNVTSVCLFDSRRVGEDYTVSTNVRSIVALQSYFPDYEFQVRIVGSGEVHEAGGGICGITTLDGPGWVDIGSIDADGIYSIRPRWQNNCNDERYDVTLEYRVRPVGGTAWETYQLDTIQLRIDQDTNDCDADHFDYDVECSPWDDRYECPEGVQAGA